MANCPPLFRCFENWRSGRASQRDALIPDSADEDEEEYEAGQDPSEEEVSDAGDSEADASDEWVNALVRSLWPRMGHYVRDLVTSKIQPAIDHKLPKYLRGTVAIGEVDFGSVEPRIGPIIAAERTDEALVIEVPIDLTSDLIIDIKVSMINVGFRQIAVKGTLTLVLRPPLRRPPFFAGVELYFIDPPTINFRFEESSIANSATVYQPVLSAVRQSICQRMVLPSRIAIDLAKDDKVDAVDLRFPEPLGILCVTLLSASDLPPADANGLADPFVMLEAGQESWFSEVVNGTLNPTWGSSATSFAIHSLRQSLRITVFDKDWIKSDDLMCVGSLIVEELLAQGKPSAPRMIAVPVEPQGSVRLSVVWLTPSPPLPRELPPLEPPGSLPRVFVFVKVGSITSLLLDAATTKPPFVVHVRLSSWEARTMPSTGKLAQGSTHVTNEKRRVCRALGERGMPSEEIAQILELPVETVRGILATPDYQKAQDLLQAAIKKRAELQPQFNEAVHLCVPWTAEIASAMVSLELRDKNGQQVGMPVYIDVQSLARYGELSGGTDGFNLGGGGNGIRLDATLRLQWLWPT